MIGLPPKEKQHDRKNINSTKILEQNKNSWDAMADSWFGSTALPSYGCLVPSEEELQLFPDLTGKKFLISAAEAAIP